MGDEARPGMARVIGKLTALAVDKAKRRGYYGDGGGLFLQVSASGSKSWVFRFKEAGKLREMGLGATHTIGLAEAREKARACRRLRLDGIDPIEARKIARSQARLDAAKAMTFKDCAERCIASHRAGWRSPTHAAQWPSTLGRYVYPIFGSLSVQAVDVGLVLKALEPIWTTKPETASRVRGRIEAVLDWATARGYRNGENPARWRGHIENLLPKKSKVRRVRHHAALSHAEIGDFMAQLRQQQGVAARALEFTVLTATRTGEVIGARWSEINFAERLWTIPAERMKSGKEHRVPLTDAAFAILDQMQPMEGDYVFRGGEAHRPISNMAMIMTLRRMGRGDLTVHGRASGTGRLSARTFRAKLPKWPWPIPLAAGSRRPTGAAICSTSDSGCWTHGRGSVPPRPPPVEYSRSPRRK
jgi:integrase